jgi:thiosulfate/3-mercaptopyruvate sulfurtransferase
VVLYDRGLSFWAARVWWMLRWIGFDRAALLDGGFKVWRAEDRPLSVAPDNHPARTLSCNLRPSLIANRDQVREAIDDDDVQLIDTLPEPSYRGEMTLYGRPGHIPGAVNLCTMALLDESGRYRPDAELAAMHSFDPDSRTITYCGGGIMASASAFAMTRLGYRDVAVYTASLQEWAADPDNPMTS